ncbi:MAG TPA: hypothetical protein DET40_16725 [Lentisphaeria bacterium]|nr:MAG: hypothetical protein A2X45_13020 [Lentisphaerae bacterium GWF2_50_93]HCE45185.1 hypothetical protein [Lentisphaeria bacterium]
MKKLIKSPSETEASLIEMVGVGYQHDSKFAISRPKGLGSYLFLHFLTHVKALTREGTVVASPGDCLIYGPKDPQLYHGNGSGLGNDWLHADPVKFGRLIEQLGIPVGTLIKPGRSDFIAPLMTEISHELLHRRPFSSRMIYLLAEKLLLELARQLKEKSDISLTPRKRELLVRLREARFKIHGDFQKRWTVSEMARLPCLSPSRFTVLYKEFFNVSPVDDLINVRLERAKWLLSNSHLTVAEACFQSGFENIFYFSRIFRRKVGIPPSKYGGRITAKPISG